jgi:hypothetical protein
MKVKIISIKNKEVWYKNKIGECFEVKEDYDGDYDLTDNDIIEEIQEGSKETVGGLYIFREDAEAIQN